MVATSIAPVPLADEVAGFFAHQPRLTASPYGMYRRLREEAPVFRHADMVLISRYADAKEVLSLPTTWQGLAAKGSRYRKAEMSLDDRHREQLAETFGFLEKRLGGANGARHSRLRRLAQKAFTPRMIAMMEQRIDEIVQTLLDPLVGRDEVELIGDFAFHVPLIVISEMLDIPTSDRDRLRGWATDLGQFVGADWSSPANVESAKRAVFSLREYLTGVFDDRRGGPTTDLLGALIAAEGDGGERFSEDELVAMILQFVFAGHETTTNTIGNAMALFLNDEPEQWRMLVEDPSLLPNAIEEVLRFAAP
ncbi:MAG: hypothetical protein QOG64_733, partial [Acidimicrobiaceae bacterium]|nr:hypothetical protein [Acidimicrobiaceae bacterium]